MTTSAGTKVELFEKWLRTVCFQAPTKEAHDLAKEAWLAAAPSAPVQAGELVKRLRYQLGRLENAVKDVREYGAEHILADGPEGCETHRSALEWLELIAMNAVREAKQAAAEIERLSGVSVQEENWAERLRGLQIACREYLHPDYAELVHTVIERLSAAATVGKSTDEKGRPLTHWGGMAEKVDAGSAEPVALELAVQRFLGWRLPENFNPDAGISFKPDYNEGTQYPMKHQPVGTNLFTADQAREMLKYVLQEYTRPPAPKVSDEIICGLDSVAIGELAEEVALSIAEIPDRNSPDDQPEMMLVTSEEIIDKVSEAIRTALELAVSK